MTTRADLLQSSWVAGEWSEDLWGQVSARGYAYSARRIRNMIPTKQGPLIRRPGTIYVSDALSQSGLGGVRLLSYAVSERESFVLELSHKKMRVLQGRGIVSNPLSSSRSYTIPSHTASGYRTRKVKKLSGELGRYEITLSPHTNISASTQKYFGYSSRPSAPTGPTGTINTNDILSIQGQEDIIQFYLIVVSSTRVDVELRLSATINLSSSELNRLFDNKTLYILLREGNEYEVLEFSLSSGWEVEGEDGSHRVSGEDLTSKATKIQALNSDPYTPQLYLLIADSGLSKSHIVATFPAVDSPRSYPSATYGDWSNVVSTRTRQVSLSESHVVGDYYQIEYRDAGSDFLRLSEGVGAPYEFDTPWGTEELATLRTVRSGDVMWVVCGSCQPYTITHYSVSDWRIEPMTLRQRNRRALLGFGNLTATSVAEEIFRATLTFEVVGDRLKTYTYRTHYPSSSQVDELNESSVTAGSLTSLLATETVRPFDLAVLHIPHNHNLEHTLYRIQFKPHPQSSQGYTFLIEFFRPTLAEEATNTETITKAHDKYVQFFRDVDQVLQNRSFYFYKTSDPQYLLEIPYRSLRPIVLSSYVAPKQGESQVVELDLDNVKYIDEVEDLNIKLSSRLFGVSLLGFVEGVPFSVDGSGSVSTTMSIAGSNLPLWSNWPTVVGFHDQRLIFAACARRPQTLWFSSKGIFDDFNTHIIVDAVSGAELEGADGSIVVGLAARDLNRIEWLFSSHHGLLLGTEGGEWIIRGGSGVISPSEVFARQVSNHGTSEVLPVRIEDQVVFVQGSGRTVRALNFSSERDSFVSQDLGVFARHLLEGGVRGLGYQEERYSLIWCLLADGGLLSCVYDGAEGVLGWSRHDLGGGGFVEDLTVSPGGRGEVGDDLWLVVRRRVGAGTRRTLEVLPGVVDTDLRTTSFLDSSIQYHGSKTHSFKDLGHLVGETVLVVGDGAFLEEVGVSSGGTLNVSRAVGDVVVGLRYLSEVRTCPQGASRIGDWLGKRVRITQGVLRLFRTLEGLQIGVIGGSGDAVTTNFETTRTAVLDLEFVLDRAPTLFTGFYRFTPFMEDIWEPSVWLYTDGPGPLNLQALLLKVQVFDE